MEWKVWWFDPSKGTVVLKDVFNLSCRFNDGLDELFSKPWKNIQAFEENLKPLAMYCFWSKCEHEILLKPWASYGEEIKIDVYDQLRANWASFVAVVWQGYQDKKGKV